MKKLKALGIIAGVLVMALSLCMPILRPWVIGWVRYRGTTKALEKNHMAARANLMPVKKTFDLNTLGRHAVDIGYAKFAVEEEEAPATIKTKNGTDLVMIVDCKDFTVVFLNPSPPAEMDESERRTMEGSRRTYPKAAAFMQEMCTDEVAAKIAAEQTRPATFAECRAMSEDDYLLYNQKLILKITLATGDDDVFWFENTQTKGVAEIGDAFRDPTKGHILLSSTDGQKIVGCHVAVRNGKQCDDVLGQIAATFVFTVDNIADKNEIRRRIDAAGIK
ncbi:MAG TPA: hypothetical protein VG733_09695 [Chthoniobacteraceae bacterium]|nr:hypothetical protein [Chthoniobacteraceae bacterium]